MGNIVEESLHKYRQLNQILQIGCFIALVLTFYGGQQLQAHGGVTVDGAAGDWCAPGAGGGGPDTLASLTLPGCALGTELFWNDFDAVADGGGADTIGWAIGGTPGAPGFGSVSDTSVDIQYFAATGSPTTLYFLVGLGPFPPFHVSPAPHIQIAIDADGPTGNKLWYDPIPVMPAGGVPPPNLGAPIAIGADYLITTDLAAVAGPTGTLWEKVTAAGVWTAIGPVAVGWSGPGVPGIVEIGVPYVAFTPGPVMGPAVSAPCTVMSSHGAASGLLGGVADAPATPPDDLISEVVPGTFTFTPDPCASGPAVAGVSPSSTACELIIGPGTFGVVSADAYLGSGGTPHVVPVELRSFTVE